MSAIEVTDPGMVMEVRFVQSWKAESPIEVTPSDMTTVVKDDLLSCQGVFR